MAIPAFHVADVSSLRQRWRRARLLVAETRDQRGAIASLLLLLRLMLVKGPILLQSLFAAQRAKEIRRATARLRVTAPPEELYFAFAITGGLGDCLVIARFVRDLMEHCGAFRFDLFSPKPLLTAWAFGRMQGFGAAHHDLAFDQLLGSYDLCLRANQHVIVYQQQANWQATYQRVRLMQVLDHLQRFRGKIDVLVQHHPWMDHHLARCAVFAGAARRDFLHMMAGIPYGGDRLPVPADAMVGSRFGLEPGAYVTVHNGFDTDFVISGRRATKCYPHFGAVVAALRKSLPNLQFVQIGVGTSEPIGQCDLMLLRQTTMDEAAGLIAGAALHLDNEGGLVHLASCLGTQSAVLFGPTPSDYFAYPSNINFDPPVCGDCWWMTRSWMDSCAKGHDTPLCLSKQDPEMVARRILVELGRTGSAATTPATNPTRLAPAGGTIIETLSR